MSLILNKAITGNIPSSARRQLATPVTSSADAHTQVIGPAGDSEQLLLTVSTLTATSVTIKGSNDPAVFVLPDIALIDLSTGNLVTSITATGSYLLTANSGLPSLSDYFELTQNGAGLVIYSGLFATTVI